MKKITIVPLLVGILLAVVFAFPDFTSPFCQAGEKDAKTTSPPGKGTARKDIQWLVFSATEHQRERRMVIEQHEQWITPKLLRERSGHVYIALADLKDDGDKEIFVYVEGGGFCGTDGCLFNLYQVRGRRLVSIMDLGDEDLSIFIDFDKSGSQKVFGVLQSKTMGWHDIVLHDDGFYRWRWKGKHYGGEEPLD